MFGSNDVGLAVVVLGSLFLCSAAVAQNASSSNGQGSAYATGVTVAGETAVETPVQRRETDAERTRRIKAAKELRARNEPKRNVGASYGSVRLYNTNPSTLSTGVVSEGKLQTDRTEERSVPITSQRLRTTSQQPVQAVR